MLYLVHRVAVTAKVGVRFADFADVKQIEAMVEDFENKDNILARVTECLQLRQRATQGQNASLFRSHDIDEDDADSMTVTDSLDMAAFVITSVHMRTLSVYSYVRTYLRFC